MRLASKGGIGWREQQAFRWLRLRKRIHQYVKFRPGQTEATLMVVGCQRSGTSMIHHVFRNDFRTATFDEVSPLSSHDTVEGLRLDPVPEVQARFAKLRAPIIVFKPLVESQNLGRLLEEFPDSRALWMFRDYRAVARSNLKFFGQDNGLKDLAPIVADDATNWRSEHLAEADRESIRGLYAPDMDPHDAAALFWFARNSLFFSRGYDRDPRILPCRYEDLVTNPGAVMADVYRFMGQPYPGDQIVADVFTGSRDKGRDLELSGPVEALCDGLLERLNALPRAGVSGR